MARSSRPGTPPATRLPGPGASAGSSPASSVGGVEGHGEVTAECEETRPVGRQGVGRGLDLLDRLVQVEGVGRDVARVRDLLGGEWRDGLLWVVRTQQPGRLADVRRAEPRTGPVA